MERDASTLPDAARAARIAEPGDPATAPRWRYAAVAAVKIALPAVVLWFVGRAMARQLAQIAWADVDFRAHWLVLSILVICLGTFVSTIGFSVLFARCRQRPGLAAVCAAWWISSLGKYVPGKFACAAGATYLLTRCGLPAATAAGIWGLQQIVTVVGGLIVVLPLCGWGPLRQRYPVAGICIVVVLGLCLLGLHPRVLGRLARRVLVRLSVDGPPLLPSVRMYLLSTAWCAGGWLLLGVATWLAVRSVMPLSAAAVPVLAASMSLASVAGVLAIVPGGLGVREGLLLVLLPPLLGPYTSLMAVLMRLLVTIAEVVLAIAGLLIYRRLERARCL